VLRTLLPRFKEPASSINQSLEKTAIMAVFFLLPIAYPIYKPLGNVYFNNSSVV